jgi:hypothetical protein
MSLRDAILSVGVDATAEDIIAALNADVSLPYDRTLRGYGYVAERFGVEAAEGLAQAMDAAGLTTAKVAYATVGFDLSHDLTQAHLSAIAAASNTLAPVCVALMQTGRPLMKRFQQFGLEALPTTGEVESDRSKLLNEQWLAAWLNEVAWPAVASGKTRAEIAQLCVAAAGG